MNERLSSAIDYLREKPGFQEYPQFRWSTDDVKEVEDVTGLRIPTDLKEMFLESGGISLENQELYFRGRFPDGTDTVGEIQIMINDADQVIDFHRTLVVSEETPGRLDPKYIVFGTADGGNSFLMVDGTTGDGAIYFWPLAFDQIGEGDNAQGVAKVSDSLPEFIEALRTIDEI